MLLYHKFNRSSRKILKYHILCDMLNVSLELQENKCVSYFSTVP